MRKVFVIMHFIQQRSWSESSWILDEVKVSVREPLQNISHRSRKQLPTSLHLYSNLPISLYLRPMPRVLSPETFCRLLYFQTLYYFFTARTFQTITLTSFKKSSETPDIKLEIMIGGISEEPG